MASVNAAGKSTPKEAQIMAAILKDMGVNEYEPRVVNQMMEFSYREYMFHSRKHHSRVRANVRKGTADSAPPPPSTGSYSDKHYSDSDIILVPGTQPHHNDNDS